MIEIKMTKTKGRGVFARVNIDKYFAICEPQHLIVLSYEDTIKIQETELKHYTYSYTEGIDCLVLGFGSLFNHSDEPNVRYQVFIQGPTSYMHFAAARDIEAGEELTIDYRKDCPDLDLSYLGEK